MSATITRVREETRVGACDLAPTPQRSFKALLAFPALLMPNHDLGIRALPVEANLGLFAAHRSYP